MDKIRVTCKCPSCGKTNYVDLSENEWFAWMLGEHIQNVAPHLSAEERELLISGTCNDCWNKMWKEG